MKELLPVELTPTEIDELKKAIHNIPDDYLNAAQKNVLSGIFNCMLWMVAKLEESKLSIKRLRRLFGCKTEKKDCSAVVDLTKSFVGPPCPAERRLVVGDSPSSRHAAFVGSNVSTATPPQTTTTIYYRAFAPRPADRQHFRAPYF